MLQNYHLDGSNPLDERERDTDGDVEPSLSCLVYLYVLKGIKRRKRHKTIAAKEKKNGTNQLGSN